MFVHGGYLRQHVDIGFRTINEETSDWFAGHIRGGEGHIRGGEGHIRSGEGRVLTQPGGGETFEVTRPHMPKYLRHSDAGRVYYCLMYKIVYYYTVRFNYILFYCLLLYCKI